MERPKIKIIHIMQSAGGVAEYVKELIRNMDKNKYENTIIVSNDYINNYDILNQCDKYYFVDMIRKIDLKKDLSSIIKIKKIIKKEKPDIVYLHSSKAGALGRIALLFDTKIKIIYNAHGWYFNADIGKKKILYKWIEKILAVKANKIVAISNSEYKSAIEEHVCKNDKMVLINNGIDIKKFSNNEEYRKETRNKYKIKNDEIIVGIVGRISEQKDPITTIKAASKIIKQNKKFKFMFVGTGELKKTILEYAKKEEIESNIIITGWINNVEKYIPAFAIALFPSKWEGFGLAIVEYMACKKPIIATRIGGIADILNDSNCAFFISKGDYDGIVKQINYILENGNKIKKIVEKNYNECIDRFSIEQEVNLTETLIENLLNRTKET